MARLAPATDKWLFRLVGKEKMKRRWIIVAALGLLLVAMAAWQAKKDRDRTVEYWFRMFTTILADGKQADAYALTSADFQERHPFAEFQKGPWCDASNVVHMTAVQHNGMHQVYVRGMSPRRVTVITSTAALTLPLWLEDGFIATIVPMKKEDGRWLIDGEVDTMMK